MCVNTLQEEELNGKKPFIAKNPRPKKDVMPTSKKNKGHI